MSALATTEFISTLSCHVDCYAHDVAQHIVFHFSYSRFS